MWWFRSLIILSSMFPFSAPSSFSKLFIFWKFSNYNNLDFLHFDYDLFFCKLKEMKLWRRILLWFWFQIPASLQNVDCSCVWYLMCCFKSFVCGRGTNVFFLHFDCVPFHLVIVLICICVPPVKPFNYVVLFAQSFSIIYFICNNFSLMFEFSVYYN